MILTDAMPSRSSRTSKRAWPNSRSISSVIPRASRRRRGGRPFCQGGELAKSAEISATLDHFRPLAEAAKKHSQSHGTLAFMATDTRH